MFSKDELLTIKWVLLSDADKLTTLAEKRFNFLEKNNHLLDDEVVKTSKELAQKHFDEAGGIYSILNKIDTLSLQD